MPAVKNRHSQRKPFRPFRWIAAALALAAASYLFADKHHKNEDQMDAQKRAQHALERLTFGPRPGDVQAVTAMGLDKWIEQQLHPSGIDDTAMTARLAEYRTLPMSGRELLLDFPPNQVAKAVVDGKIPMPRDAYEHAIYAAAIERLQQKQEKKQAAAQSAAQAATGKMAEASENMMAAPSPHDTSSVTADVRTRRQDRREAHSLIDDLSQLPADARMQRILSLPVEQQIALTQGLPPEKRAELFAGLSPVQRETILALNNPVLLINSEVQSAKLLRAVYSQRQLEEVLTDFWFNHFNIFLGKAAERRTVTAYERDVIRPHVLGKFEDLLIATARSPAMVQYLDNWASVGPNSDAALNGPPAPGMYRRGMYYPRPNAQHNAQTSRRSGLNENYARELMELQTLGVNGGYTQKDVTEVARVFTGWTLEEMWQGGAFIFRPRIHEPGDKIVLGHRIKAGGEGEGIEVLTLLAHQPATARFISTELAQRFVSDNPPSSLIDAMSDTYMKKDGDLREVLRTMFYSREFWSPEAYRARVKTPLEFVASALRATNAQISDPMPLVNQLNRMGMPLYGMQPPTGYSTRADVWVNSAALLDRMNFGLALAMNRLPGTHFDLAPLTTSARALPPGVNASDPYQMQLQLEKALLAGDVSKQTHETIESQIASPTLVADDKGQQTGPQLNVIAGLLLGSPEFQRK